MAFNNPPALLNTTWANIPATYTIGQPVFVSNAGTKGSFWYYDGTRWKPQNGYARLATLDAPSASVANTPTIILQYLIPVGMWQTNDIIRFRVYIAKSGTTDTALVYFYAGTAGTTADTLLTSSTWMAASNQTNSGFIDFRLASATTARQATINVGQGGSSVALPAAVAISSAASNALYVSIGIASAGTTDTVQLGAAAIELFSTAN